MDATPHHIRRTGILLHLSPMAQALLCDCERCRKDVEVGFNARAERQTRNRKLNPPCPVCSLPMIWRELFFVCPYSENVEMHRRIAQKSCEVTATWT